MDVEGLKFDITNEKRKSFLSILGLSQSPFLSSNEMTEIMAFIIIEDLNKTKRLK